MEKILLVLNAHKPDVASIAFACRMAEFAETMLTGLVIENPSVEHEVTASGNKHSYFDSNPEKNLVPINADTDQTIRIFLEECDKLNVKGEVYQQHGDPAEQVKFESRFADLLIIDPEMDLYEREEALPTHFLREILANAECAVLLAPRSFEDVEEIIFSYDGTASSVFAIKQFTYLMPEFSSKKVTLLEVNSEEKKVFKESDRRMMDWLRAHYHAAYFHSLRGNPKDELITFLFMKRKKLVVMGAYGRNMLSNLLRKSSADVLVRMVDLPLFITHP